MSHDFCLGMFPRRLMPWWGTIRVKTDIQRRIFAPRATITVTVPLKAELGRRSSDGRANLESRYRPRRGAPQSEESCSS
jgi:hypothetical protein